MKFELDLYFMVLHKCRKYEENPSTRSKVIIWKPLGDGQDGLTDTELQNFSEAIT
jgi:hypothetical protein